MKRAYEDPEKKFEAYLTEVGKMFNFAFMSNQSRDQSIRNFSDYLNVFLHFLKDKFKKYPITFSSWMQSKWCTPYVSGLFFDIGGYDRGDDEIKVDGYLKTENFEIIQNLAIRNGFYVAKHAPYIDLQSPVTIRSMKTDAFFNQKTDLSSVIRAMYTPCWTIDIQLLKKTLVRFYNQLIAEKDYISLSNNCQVKSISNC